MSTMGHSAGKAPAKRGGNQVAMLVVAVLLLLGAVGIVIGRQASHRAEEARKTAAADPKVQMQQIENNQNMPPQAKAIALQQIRAHAQETQGRGPGMPGR